MFKKALCLAMVAVLAISMAACASSAPSGSTAAPSGNTPSSPSTSDAAPVEASNPADTQAQLRIIWWGSQTRHEYTQAALDVFTEKYPNITFSSEFVAFDGYWQKLATMSASKSLPDVLQQDYKYITQYAKNDLIIDMKPYIENGILDLSDSPESMWSSGIVDDKLVGICLGVNSTVSMINTELFAQAGIEVPPHNWSYDEYIVVLDQLLAKKDELGIHFPEQGVQNNCYEITAARLRQNGMSFFATDGSNAFGFEKEEGRKVILEYIQQEKENIEMGRSAPLAVRDEAHVNGAESGPIVRGQAAILTGQWSNQIKAVSNAAGKPFTLVAVPDLLPGDTKAQFIKPSQFFSVATNSQYKDQAVFFVNAVTNDIDVNMELKAERGVPISDTVRAALAETFDPDSVDKTVFDFISEIAPVASPTPVAEPTTYGSVFELLKNLFKTIIDEGGDPDKAFDAFYDQAMTEFQMA